MISFPRPRVIAGVIAALIVFCYTARPEARAQAGSRSSRQAKAAPRPSRSQPQAENEKAREYIEEGLRSAEQKDWVGAFKAFDQSLAISPRYGDAYIAMGDTYINMGKYVDGIKAYRQAISVAPSNPDAHYGLGAAFNETQEYGEAIKHFAQAIRLDPDFAEAHYGIGYAYLKREKFNDALTSLRRAARLQPDYWGTHLALGQTYLGLEDVKAAEKELEILARLDARAAGALEKEIRNTHAIANLSNLTERGGQSESAPRPREKSVTTNTAQEQSAVTTTRSAAQNQSSIPMHSPVPTPRPAALSVEAGLTVELSFWESVKNSGDPEEFAAYLKKYPEGAFAELARIRMRALASKKGEVAGENLRPKQPPLTDNTSTPDNPSKVSTPDNLSKPGAQTSSYDGIAQQPKEQLSEEQPTEEQPAKELPKEQPAAEKPRSNETGDTADAATVEAALDSLRRLLPSNFSYQIRSTGEASAGGAISAEVKVNYEPLKFEGCTVRWRDQNDELWVSLPEIDPGAVKVGPRSMPDTTLSIEVWNVSIATLGGRDAINEARGDGSGTVNRYNSLDLQYDLREKAERLAAALRQAIRLCGGKP
ncbi:MAG: tetratricopeptide repeat protein [Acidobacteria bacterium]|nr:tetratricopeptide repeat protein [Acidobacteriota bacterium]